MSFPEKNKNSPLTNEKSCGNITLNKTQGRRVVSGKAHAEKCRLVRDTMAAELPNWLQSGRAEGK